MSEEDDTQKGANDGKRPVGVGWKAALVTLSLPFLRHRRQNAFRYGTMFHPPNDGGEILLASGCGLSGVDCRGCLSRRH